MSDHAGLATAGRSGEVVAAYVVAPNEAARAERNPRRAAYRRNAVASLARELAERNSPLIVRHGRRVAAVLRLVREAKAGAVVWSASYDARAIERDRELQSALEEAGVRATIVHDAPAVAPDETAAARSEDGGRGYRALGPYIAAWSTLSHAPIATRVHFASHALASDALDPQVVDFEDRDGPVAEAGALAEIDAYVAGPILQYPIARYVPASEPTARISAALSFGVLSARTVLARIDERLRDPFLLVEERLAIATFIRSVARRDFFLQLGWFFDDAPDVALQERMRAFRFARTHPALDAWREGRTGYPLVDAGMRQLRATGWMHPRVRSVVASFLCFDLGVDWRIGRDCWDACLVEDEPALANGNWQWVCGVGADLAQFPRIYNPRKQARAIDPRGRYVRRFVPELANVADADLFARSPVGQRRQLMLELFDRPPYPVPVVDHDVAARAFLTRYAAFARDGAASKNRL